MNMPPEMTDVIRRWIDKAESDFLTAKYVLTMGEKCPLFHRSSLPRKLGSDR